MKKLTITLIRVTLVLAAICIVSIALAFFTKAAPLLTIIRSCIFLSFFFVLIFGSLISFLLYQIGQASEGRLLVLEQRVKRLEAPKQ